MQSMAHMISQYVIVILRKLSCLLSQLHESTVYSLNMLISDHRNVKIEKMKWQHNYNLFSLLESSYLGLVW